MNNLKTKILIMVVNPEKQVENKPFDDLSNKLLKP